MAFKIAVFAAVIALASTGTLSQIEIVSGPVTTKTIADAEYNPHPEYSFSYDVNDPVTGDIKHQVETRNGDSVKGQYSLAESDGTKRVVDYAADPVTGFNAVVSKVPLDSPVASPGAVKSIPVAVRAPLAYRVASAPIGYNAAYTSGFIDPLAYRAGYSYGLHPYSYPYYRYNPYYGYHV